MCADFTFIFIFPFNFLSFCPAFCLFKDFSFAFASILFPIRTFTELLNFACVLAHLLSFAFRLTAVVSNFLALAFINLDWLPFCKLTLNSFTNQFRLHMYAFLYAKFYAGCTMIA